MGAINILYSRIFFDWVFICFIRMVYPKSQQLYRTGFKVKSTIHN